MKTKIAIFTGLLLSMITYIGWIFYMSEPHYIDNPQSNEVEKYDIVSIRPYGDIENSLDVGMVIQIDTTSFNNHYAVVKSTQWRDRYKDIQLNTITPNFKIIGKGTFYHKVNYFIGFNIMMITTVLIMIIAGVLFATLIGLLREFLGFDPLF